MTDPTMAALDAAVARYRAALLDDMSADYLQLYGGSPLHPANQRKYDRDVAGAHEMLAALIAAAEARGAAKATVRECVWVLGEDADGDPCFVTSCGDHLFSDFAWLTFCHHCGGRVRVEEVGDD